MNKPQLIENESDLPPNIEKIDSTLSALAELFFIENPTIDKRGGAAKEKLDEYLQKNVHSVKTVWVYYPKKHLAIKIPSEDIYYTLRTARNRNLILEDEQIAYRNYSVGIAGLSVGSAVLAAIVQTGGPKKIKIADPDIIEITNLNRIKATLSDVGRNKTHVAGENVWDLDPFAELELWENGITKESLEEFILGKNKLDVFIDEMDNIQLKIASRIVCKNAGVPVVMATDNGDSVIVDIERFDLEPERPIFHGQVTEDEYDFNPKSSEEFIRMANKIIDPNFFTKRQLESVQSIGSTLSGIAQLSTAAMIAGASVAYVVRGLASKQNLPSGRYVLGCDHTFL